MWKSLLTKRSSPYTLLAHYGELDWVSFPPVFENILMGSGGSVRRRARLGKNERRSGGNRQPVLSSTASIGSRCAS